MWNQLLSCLSLLALTGCLPAYCGREAMHGIVVDRAGKAIEGATVSAVDLEDEPGSNPARYKTKIDSRYIVKTDGAGHFQIAQEGHFVFFWLAIVPPEDPNFYPRPHGLLQASYKGGTSVAREFGNELGIYRIYLLQTDDPVSMDMGAIVINSPTTR
jgi:hypothetical protein